MGRLLFKDIEIIRQIRDYSIAITTHTVPEDNRFPQTPAQYIANPLLVQPSTARWLHVPNRDAKADRSEFELEWRSSLDGEVNYDRLAMILAFAIPWRKSVEDVFRCIEKQTGEDLIYPKLPIRIYGRLSGPSDIARSSIRVRAESTNQYIQVKCNSAHRLSWSADLFNRHLFALGIVSRIDHGIVVTAGALMF